jgi:hypothetical protein
MTAILVGGWVLAGIVGLALFIAMHCVDLQRARGMGMILFAIVGPLALLLALVYVITGAYREERL